MKRIFLLLAALWLVGVVYGQSERRVYRVSVRGRVADCPVVIGDVPSWARSVVVTSAGQEIASQLDVALGEAAFVADIRGGRDFEVTFASEPATRHYTPRVHAQMWLKNSDKSLSAVDSAASMKDDMYKKLHHHGPAFESEYAAYRIYFDKKQSIDTYGKKRPQLELSETMWYPSDQQLAAGYGHDNLRVFGSVSVGALKGWDAQTGRMTHIDKMKRRESRILAAGPVRTVVDMRVEGWQYGDREITMTSRYILYAGHSDVQVENRIEGDCTGLVFTTGVMKQAENEVYRRQGMIAAWGADFPENDTLKWERERVGLAVYVPRERIVSQIDDPESYLLQLTPDARGRIDYSFEMLWRKSEWSEVSDAPTLFRHAVRQAKKINSRPVVRRIWP